LSCGGLAQAELITIKISGYVTSVSDDNKHFGGQIAFGTPITGTYTYDSATLDSNPSLTVGDYQNNNSSTGISLNVGGFNFKTDPTNVNFLVEILNDDGIIPVDAYLLRSYHNLPLSNGTLVQYINWDIHDYTAMALSSDSLPLGAPDLSELSDNALSIFRDRDYGITATITSATPEPTTAFLLGFGMMLAGKKLRR
jgi:hypothetical protein